MRLLQQPVENEALVRLGGFTLFFALAAIGRRGFLRVGRSASGFGCVQGTAHAASSQSGGKQGQH
jgi:hypothetical protein